MLTSMLKAVSGIFILMGIWAMVQAFIRQRMNRPGELRCARTDEPWVRRLRRGLHQRAPAGELPGAIAAIGEGIMNLSEYDISKPLKATLLSTDRITPDNTAEVRHITLQLPGDGFEFVEGQSIGVLVPGPHEFGNPYHLRLYSIASSRKGEHGSGGVISICVRRCFYIDEISGEQYPGKASNYLCDALCGAAFY